MRVNLILDKQSGEGRVRIVGKMAVGVVPLALLAGAAFAQQPPSGSADGRGQEFNVTAEERAALVPVQTAIAARNWAAAQTALGAAVAAARTPDARYAVGRFQLEIGLGTNDVTMQAHGIDNLIASGRVPASDLPVLYRNQGVLANNAGDKAKAEAAFARVVELSPNDPEALIQACTGQERPRKAGGSRAAHRPGH